MESGFKEENCPKNDVENPCVNDDNSAEHFQKFIFELFEKNGILHDLRAYLRGHIVNVLKNAQTDDPPTCQKHFTQRLDLTFQALNIIIAEYLLRMDFSYSLSVFVSEIPLSNMVFEFSKTLMQNDNNDYSGIKFKDTDIWSILNYLGVKCDSSHASSIVQMYKNEDYTPLLLCILKCIPLYCKESVVEAHENSSNESLSSSINSSDTLEGNTKNSHRNLFHEKCKHYVVCKTCQNKVTGLKNKYRRKKKSFTKNIKASNNNQLNLETIMRNINIMERSLIDELFEQLKSVYEAEAAIMKQEEDKKIKRSLANHAIQLRKHRDELEESFKAREAELECSVQQKKRFLWGLAKALRDQHRHLSNAMKEVREETGRLTAKEVSLKTELAKAEDILKQRGEEMCSHISSELVVLQGHLEDMKKERDSIDKERSEFEVMKAENSSNDCKSTINHDDLRSHYDLLKNEIIILKKYLDSTKLEPKCVIERSTMTECDSPPCVVLNNGKDDYKSRRSKDKVKASQVVNDLKKQKNVNFSPSNLDELFRERSQDRSHSRSRSSASSEAGDVAEPERSSDQNLVHQLKEENDRLKNFARQQRSHIDELSSQQARLAAELAGARRRDTPPVWRPRTAPTVMPQSNILMQSLNTSASANTLSFGWRKGAGEEISLFSNAQPRIIVPGDTLPFIGVLRDRHDSRRHLINQWRALRRCGAPLRVLTRPAPAPAAPTAPTAAATAGASHADRNFTPTPGSVGPSESIAYETPERDVASKSEPAKRFQKNCKRNQSPMAAVTIGSNKNRDKSPKSVLKESKKKNKNKDNMKGHPITPEKSPNAVLREAKLRLRKLEIEAEAVEKSYLDFRRRQNELREERLAHNATTDEQLVGEFSKKLDTVRSRSVHIIDEAYSKDIEKRYQDAHKNFQNNFDTYHLEYPSKIDIDVTHIKNRNTVAERMTPHPVAFIDIIRNEQLRERRNNYLEAPLNEFRKLYNSEKVSRPESSKQSNIENTGRGTSSDNYSHDSNPRNSAVKRARHNKKAELEILKKNIVKIYNLQDQAKIVPIAENLPKTEPRFPLKTTEANKNLLRVEVESLSEVNDVQMLDSQTQDLVLVVGSSETRNLNVSKPEEEEISTKMTFIVSPKQSPKEVLQTVKSPNFSKRSETPEQAAGLTREDVLDAIFNADPDDHYSSEQMDVLAEDIEADSINEEVHGEDHLDDFSADVDNYNTRSDYGNRSPISIQKTSEDENFWDS